MSIPPPPTLHVVAVVRDRATHQLIERVIEGSGDAVTFAPDLAEGLACCASEAPDLVLVEVGLDEGAGLAVVHHMRALAPRAAVYALATPAQLELATQAVALGSTGVFMLPLAGDELLSALSGVRTRIGEQWRTDELEREVQGARLAGELLDALDAMGECVGRRQAARSALETFVTATRARRGAVFLRPSEASRELMLTEQIGEFSGLPGFCAEMDLMRYAAAQEGIEVVRLASRTSQQGVLLLGDIGGIGSAPTTGSGPPLPGTALSGRMALARSGPVRAALERAAAHAAALVALGAEREAASRGTMKDPDSSAYTFAYFVDVAGREIDKARRHGRRFALATLTIETPGIESAADSVQLAEHVLAAVRDTDVLARVDDREFYLLLPETGGIGAHACRRRVMRHFRQAAPQAQLSIGVSTYPHDGGDLSGLMRVARHRADASRDSVVSRLDLASSSLTDVLERLLGYVIEGTSHGVSPEQPRVLTLPRADIVRLAAGAVNEARRSGSAWAVTTDRPGLNLSSAVRVALGAPSEEARLDCADASLVTEASDIEAFSLITEHGAYSLLGRLRDDVVHGVHTADPLFSDFLVDRLSDLVGTRLWSS